MGNFRSRCLYVLFSPDHERSSSQPFCVTDIGIQRFPNPEKAEFGISPSQIGYGGAGNGFSAGGLRRRGVWPEYCGRASVGEDVAVGRGAVRRREERASRLGSRWVPLGVCLMEAEED